MFINDERFENLCETLEELQEEAAFLNLTLLGAESAIDRRTLGCLMRLSDYVTQHVNDLSALCGRF